MKFKFTEDKITEIEKVLHTEFSRRENQYRTLLENKEKNRKLTLEIFPDIQIGTKTGNLVNVFTPSAHAQLHFCSGFVASDVLGEVTFIGTHNGRLSGIIVEKAPEFAAPEAEVAAVEEATTESVVESETEPEPENKEE